MKKQQHVALVVMLIFFATVLQVAEAKPKYIGPEKCGGCHKTEYLAWKISTHAKAFNVLKPGKRKKAKKLAKLDPEKDYTADKKCIKCHVTGYRKKAELAKVSCESCHGPGSKYAALHEEKMMGFSKEEAISLGQRYGADDKTVCLDCHTHKDSPFHENLGPKYKFDWKAALQKRKTYHPKQKKSSFSF